MLYTRRSTSWFAVSRFSGLFVPVMLGFMLISCSTTFEPTTGWQKEPLDGVVILEFRQFGGQLFAGSDRGLHVMDVERRLKIRQSTITDGKISTFLVLAEDNWIASVSFRDDPDRENNIFKSTDQGTSWIPFRNGFGGETTRTPLYLDAIREEPSVIFGGMGNVARSIDGGQSWESVLLTWDALTNFTFVKINPLEISTIWAGGSGFIPEPSLYKSVDHGESWEFLDPLKDIEATVYDVIIHPTNSARVLAGLGSGFEKGKVIRRSSDGGQTWQTVYKGIGTRALAQSPRNGRTIYASGRHATGMLFFAMSPDFGDSWELFKFDDGPGDIWVNDLLAVEQNGREVLYFATNKGVYSYRFGE